MEKLFIAWMVAFITQFSPPGRPTFVPEAKESKIEAEARYESIAQDIQTVVSEEEPLFKGPQGRIKTASVILSIMYHESGFRKDVDLGVGKLSKGDGGKSVCMMQLNIGDGRTFSWNTKKNRVALPADPKDEVSQGWTAKEILADRKKCIRAGYRIMKLSFAATSAMPPVEWLRVYASGKSDAGSKESRSRMGLALKYFGEHKPDFDDVNFLTPPVKPKVIESVEPLVLEPAYFKVWSKNALIRTLVLRDLRYNLLADL